MPSLWSLWLRVFLFLEWLVMVCASQFCQIDKIDISIKNYVSDSEPPQIYEKMVSLNPFEIYIYFKFQLDKNVKTATV